MTPRIEELPIFVRTCHALEAAGVVTIDDALHHLRAGTLQTLKGVGPKMEQDLRDALKQWERSDQDGR